MNYKSIILSIMVFFSLNHVPAIIAMKSAPGVDPAINQALVQDPEFDKGIIGRIAQSTMWNKICSFLVTIAEDVDQCQSYKGHTFDDCPTKIPTHQLHTLDRPESVKLLLLTCLQLFGQIASGLTAITIDADNLDVLTQYPTHTSAKHESCEDPFPTSQAPSHPSQRVCFSSETNTKLCCTLNSDLSINCCLANIPDRCISFNILDNHDPLFNCCKITDRAEVICSKDACLSSKSITAPCNLETKEQNFESNQTALGNTLLQSISTMYDHMSIETARIHFGFLAISSPKVNFEIPQRLDDNLDAVKTLIRYIRDIEKKFNIQPRFHIGHINIGDPHTDVTTIAHPCGVITETLRNNDLCPIVQPSLTPSSRISFAQEYTSHSLDMAWTIAHEIAHSHQAEQLFNAVPMQITESYKELSPDYQNLNPGFEISADIMGALASDYKKIPTYAARFLAESLEKERSLCQQSLPEITRANAACIENLLSTNPYYDSDPHPHDNIRATILFKLSTMIQAAVHYLEEQNNK